ncbi:MAG: alcohol dehydrogenase, partial [Dehalococcoidia bacterium]
PLHAKGVIGTLYGEIKPALDVPKLIDLMASGGFKTDKLITRKIKLEEINDAAQAMLERKIAGRWVIMMD